MKTPRFHASFRYFFTFILSRTSSVEFYKKLFSLALLWLGLCFKSIILDLILYRQGETANWKPHSISHSIHIFWWTFIFPVVCVWAIQDSVFEDTETFTCAMYGYPRESSMNIVKSKMLKMVGEDKPLSTDSKVDLTRLPPCETFLLPHVQRLNYRLCCYKKAHIPIFERTKP